MFAAPKFSSSSAQPSLHCVCSHEYAMSYQYHAMSNFFNRDNVGLQGFAAFYRVSSLEERAHAQQLMDYQVRLAALHPFLRPS